VFDASACSWAKASAIMTMTVRAMILIDTKPSSKREDVRIMLLLNLGQT